MHDKATVRTLLGAAVVTMALFATAPALADKQDPDGAVGRIGRPQLDAACTRVNVCNSTVYYNGEAWAGGNLIWRTDFIGGFLLLEDTGAGCNIVQRCQAPGGASPSELTLMNGVLYHYDFGTGLIYAIDPASCQVIMTCNPPGDDLAEGLTSLDGFLYKGDSQFIYKFAFSAAAGCQEVARCPNPPGDSADGLTVCNGQIVMLGYSGIMYRIDFDHCQITGSCQLNLGADGNGITSDRTVRLWADNVNGDLDQVDVGCSIPIPTVPTTWTGIKSFYR